MANNKSALKRIRQTEVRRVSNRYYAKTTRNAIKKFRSETSKDEAVKLLKDEQEAKRIAKEQGEKAWEDFSAWWAKYIGDPIIWFFKMIFYPFVWFYKKDLNDENIIKRINIAKNPLVYTEERKVKLSIV